MNNHINTTFQKIIERLNNPNTNVRYHAKLALELIYADNHLHYFQQFLIYLQTHESLNFIIPSQLIKTITSNTFENSEELNVIVEILQIIEKTCEGMTSGTSSAEFISLAVSLFKKQNFLPKEHSNLLKSFPFLSILGASENIITGGKYDSNFFQEVDSLQSESKMIRFAKARLISAISIYVPKDTLVQDPFLRKASKSVVDTFLADKDPEFANFMPSIFKAFVFDYKTDEKYLAALLRIIEDQPSFTKYLISAIIILLDTSKYEHFHLISRALIPMLSVIPFQFEKSLPDDNITGTFNIAVRAIMSFLNEANSVEITNFLIQNASCNDKDRKLGFCYSITCLIKLHAAIDFTNLKKCFHRVSDPLEAGTLSELAMAIYNSGYSVMNWEDMVMFLEDCYSVSDDITKPFVLDAAAVLGQKIDASPKDTLGFMSHCIYERFNFALVHFSIINSYVLDKKVSLSEFPPLLTMYIFLFMSNNNVSKYVNSTIASQFTTQTLDSVDANTHSLATRAMLDRFLTSASYTKTLISFLASFSWRTSKQETEQNLTKVLSISSNLNVNFIDELADLFAANITLDRRSGVQILQSYLQSKVSGWFIFSSNKKSDFMVKLVFLILSKLKTNLTQFIQFTVDYLPDPKDESLSGFVMDILATVLHNHENLEKEFPPKCRLFDFAISTKYLHKNSVYRCLGELLTISPICSVEQIPLITNIILESEDFSPDLIFLIIQLIKISKTPNDIQLLLQPFITNNTSSHAFKILQSVLEVFVGEQHEKEDFPCLKFDASKILDSFDSSFDDLLLVIANIIGIYLPLFDSAQLVVEFTLRIMAHLTKKIEVKKYLNLQDAIHYVSISFNSKCLMQTAELLCQNLTETAIIAFLIIFNERESELLSCVQPFIESLFKYQTSQVSLLFNSNETLAKAATTLIDTNNYQFLKGSLIDSKFKTQIRELLLDSVYTKYQLINSLSNDQDLKDIISESLPEVIYSRLMCTDTDLVMYDWDVETTNKFIKIVSNSITSMDPPLQQKFSQYMAKITIQECVPSIISIFEPLFLTCDNPLLLMTPFASNPNMIPYLVKNQTDSKMLRGIFTLAISNNTVLPYCLPFISNVLKWALNHQKIVKLIIRQNDIHLLRPFLPFIVTYIFNKNASQNIIELVQAICGHSIVIPTNLIDILSLCESCNFVEPDPECITLLMSKVNKGDNISLIIMCSLVKKHFILNELCFELQSIIDSLFEKGDEDSQTTALTCSTCFFIPAPKSIIEE